MNNELYQPIDRKLSEIAEYYLNEYEPSNHIGLYGGNTGISLFLALCYKHTGDERYFKKLNFIIDKIINSFTLGWNIQPPLSSGLAGWGWFVKYLEQEELIDINTNEFLHEIDDLLIDHLNRFISNGKYDQIHEAISIAIYYLKRGINKPVIQMIEALDKTKVTDNNEIKWMRHDSYRNVHVYDFGLAHGIAGYLYFLSKCYQKNILSEVCLRLIQGIIKLYRNNIQQQEHVGSYFTNSILVEDYHNKNIQENFCRLAWCYGDLGILHTLLETGKIIGDHLLVNDCIDMLQRTATRRTFKETLVEDAGLCHGASGVAHIYNKLYQQTKNECFKEAAIHWYKVTLDFSKEEVGICGYLLKYGLKGWKADAGLLTGTVGIGLSFLSTKNPKLLNWDECLLLS